MEHTHITNEYDFLNPDCRFLSVTWFTSDSNRIKPALIFCSHPKNPENLEGNCRKDVCPLIRKISIDK